MTTDHEKPFQRPLSGADVERLPTGLVPARTVLDGTAVRLEPLDPAVHAVELHQASHGTDEALKVWDYLPFGPWPERLAFTQWLREWAGRPERIYYAIRPHDTGSADGMAAYLDIQPMQGVIEIGSIWFTPTLQRTREATESLYLMLAYAMDDLAYRRMQWRCNALNERSRAAARRLGFRFEGIFFNHLIFKGKNRDTAWYSILDDEWPEVRGIITAWLADDNFDAGGRAERSLSQMMTDSRATEQHQGEHT